MFARRLVEVVPMGQNGSARAEGSVLSSRDVGEDGFSRPGGTMSIPTRGVLYVHSAPSALCPHVEWAAAGVLGGTVDVDWVPQPAESGTYRTELSWQADVGTA